MVRQDFEHAAHLEPCFPIHSRFPCSDNGIAFANYVESFRNVDRVPSVRRRLDRKATTNINGCRLSSLDGLVPRRLTSI